VAEKDWSKELAKVDKQLASLSDEALLGPPPAKAGGKASASKATTPTPPTKPTTSSFGVYARLTLSVLLGVAMAIWPFQARCGVGLAGYLGAVLLVVVSGIWSSVWTWRHRASRAHTLSLLLILWGLVLGSLELLPRLGYAKPDARHPSTWVCQ